MSWYRGVLKQYATFSGRARRMEYWMFVLINAVIALILSSLVLIDQVLSFICPLYLLAVLVPTLAVTVRRLHDTDRSGFWYFIILVPLVGGIVLFIFTLLEGTNGSNQYGDDPK